jgi:hypothetical protein
MKMTPVKSGWMPTVILGFKLLGLILPVVSLVLMVFTLAKTFSSTQGVRNLLTIDVYAYGI